MDKCCNAVNIAIWPCKQGKSNKIIFLILGLIYDMKNEKIFKKIE